MSILSQSEIAAYRTDGVLVPEFRLPPAALTHLQSLATPRIGYALRYMPATSHYDHHDLPIADSRGSAHHTRPLIQVRGRDASGLNDFRIGHPQPPRPPPIRQTERSGHTLAT